jgi:phosphatidylserine decarboxylase
MKKFIHALPQYILPHKSLTAMMGRVANSNALHQFAIRHFVNFYDVNMEEAECADIKSYACFNDFFTRHLKKEVRPLEGESKTLISPVDGTVSQIGTIEDGRIVQAKGRDYSVGELLGNPAEANLFANGAFSTLYLSPRDYHRIHFPCDASLKQMRYIPGKLFSVSPITADTIPRLFARNERLAISFNTEFGPMAIVLVGAMIVGSMTTSWEGAIPRQKKIKEWHYQPEMHFEKGKELGYFKLGSTVILLLAKKTHFAWHENLNAGSAIKFGQAIGTF